MLALGWPADVVEQWIFDNAEHFEADYGHIDLRQIGWSQIELTTEEIIHLPTGPSDAGALEQYSENPDYWLGLRPESVQQSWKADGTWTRPPLLIDRSAVSPELSGLQVLEGCCRVGQLRGRSREGLFVATRHQVWLGELGDV